MGNKHHAEWIKAMRNGDYAKAAIIAQRAENEEKNTVYDFTNKKRIWKVTVERPCSALHKYRRAYDVHLVYADSFSEAAEQAKSFVWKQGHKIISIQLDTMPQDSLPA